MKTILVPGGLLLAAALVTGCDDRTPTASSTAPRAPTAIVLGQLDPGHAYVGAIILDAPSLPWFPTPHQPWYCSGTLVASRVVQTAAHCLAIAALFAGYAWDAFPASRIHVSFADNVTDPVSWREISSYAIHPDFVPPQGTSDVALLFLQRPVKGIRPGTLPPAGLLDQFKNAELQAASFFDVGYGMLGAEAGFALTGDRRIATVGFQKLDDTFLDVGYDPGGACMGDSGGPILMESGGVEYAVATVHALHLKFNSDVKQDCTGDFSNQRLDLASVLSFIQANIASHGK